MSIETKVVIPYFDGKTIDYRDTLESLKPSIKITNEDFDKFMKSLEKKENE
jgi:hypothetical protein